MRRTLCSGFFGSRSCSRSGCFFTYQASRSYVLAAGAMQDRKGLYDAIKAAETTKDKGGGELVRLPDKPANEYNWPISTKPGMQLFVRECYPALFELANNLEEPGGGIVFTGNPGIGKSWFLNFILWKRIQEEKAVLLESASKDFMWLFDKDESWFAEFPSQDTKRELFHKANKTNAWYLFDPYGDVPREPSERSDLFTIIAASPNPKHYKQFLKRTRNKYYIPTWSWEEIEKHRPHATATIAKDLTEDQVKENFKTFGGIPRYIYQTEAQAAATKNEINSALQLIKPNTITDVLGDLELATDSHRQLSHKLLQYEVDPNEFCSLGLRFASDYVVEKVSQHLAELRLSELARAVDDLKGPMAGLLLEALAPLRLTRGGRFRTYCLKSGKMGWLTMPPRTETSNVASLAVLKKWNEVSDEDFVKCSPTFPVIDALSKEGLFNFTMAKRHSIKAKPCEELLVQLGLKEDQPVNFYWVVKDGQGAAFRGASLKAKKEGKPTKQITLEFVESRISQFALEIPTVPYEELSVADLQEMCQKKGLEMVGDKTELLRRLYGQ